MSRINSSQEKYLFDGFDSEDVQSLKVLAVILKVRTVSATQLHRDPLQFLKYWLVSEMAVTMKLIREQLIKHEDLINWKRLTNDHNGILHSTAQNKGSQLLSTCNATAFTRIRPAPCRKTCAVQAQANKWQEYLALLSDEPKMQKTRKAATKKSSDYSEDEEKILNPNEVKIMGPKIRQKEDKWEGERKVPKKRKSGDAVDDDEPDESASHPSKTRKTASTRTSHSTYETVQQEAKKRPAMKKPLMKLNFVEKGQKEATSPANERTVIRLIAMRHESHDGATLSHADGS